MAENNLRQMHCCFTGHRPEKLNLSEKVVKELLENAIDRAISDGFTTFITGMAEGSDIWGAEIVLEKKKENNAIRLVCASPYEGFENSRKSAERKKYRDILEKSDLVEYISKHYFKSCFQFRNKWMVDKSSRVIAVYNGTPGGTKNTIKYALKKAVEIDNIFKN